GGNVPPSGRRPGTRALREPRGVGVLPAGTVGAAASPTRSRDARECDRPPDRSPERSAAAGRAGRGPAADREHRTNGEDPGRPIPAWMGVRDVGALLLENRRAA